MDFSNPNTMMVFYIFGGYALIGILFVAWVSGRRQFTEELNRLGRHAKKMEEKEAAKMEVAEDIFFTERHDFLGRLLAQAGMEAKYDKMKSNWIMSTIITPTVLAALCWWKAPELLILCIIFGPALGAFGFVTWLKQMAKRRQNKMTAQLPQVLESMVSSLKAGSPVVECFKLLAETAPEPIRAEFKRSLVSLQLGKPFRDVMAEMATRIRTPDFKLLTQAIFISQDVGANLADVVATIAECIRERFRLRDFLDSLTAQGKATAVFIGCLPYFITGMTYMMAPGYITPFLNHPIARLIFLGFILWEGIGFYILIKLCTFEV